MRLGSKSADEFIQILNKKNEIIQQDLLTKIIELTKTVDVKVMMGDSTITEQKTFDPQKINNYLEKINEKLIDWSLQDVSITNNEDLRRIFTKFEITEGNYLISGHISLQFHVLLFYKPIQRVIDCQKELAEIVDKTKNKETELSNNSDQHVLDKLKEMGYKDFDHQKLFEIFYENEEFSKKVYEEIEKDAGEEFKKLTEKKNELFKELDSLLVETYQTSSVLIDDARLVAGEEGCLCTLDIEFIKNDNREGLFDPRKMSNTVKENIVKKLENLEVIQEATLSDLMAFDADEDGYKYLKAQAKKLGVKVAIASGDKSTYWDMGYDSLTYTGKKDAILKLAAVSGHDQDICPGDEDCGGYTLEESDIKSTLPKKVKLYEGMSVADKFKALMQ